MARYRQIYVDTLTGSPVSVRFDREYAEYQVRIKGQPEATYHTDSRDDALATAQHMRNNNLQPAED